jgi:hypothetical protein
MDRNELIATLEQWHHPRAWDDHMEKYQLAGEAAHELDAYEKLNKETPLKQWAEGAARAKVLAGQFAGGWMIGVNELNSIYDELKANYPHLVKHFPKVKEIGDRFSSQERAEMVGKVLAELLAMPVKKSKAKPGPKAVKNKRKKLAMELLLDFKKVNPHSNEMARINSVNASLAKAGFEKYKTATLKTLFTQAMKSKS